MRPRSLITVSTVFLLWAARLASQVELGPSRRVGVAERLRLKLEDAGLPAHLAVAGEPIRTSVMLPRFYERRGYVPAWSGEEGPLVLADELVAVLRNLPLEGLRPSDYHLAAVESLLQEVRGPALSTTARLSDLDLLLTDAYLTLSVHFFSGRVPRDNLRDWPPERSPRDFGPLLEAALSSGRVSSSLHSLLPADVGYGQLKDVLARYRSRAAGEPWPTVPSGKKLELGAIDARVATLRERLRLEGDLPQGGVFEPDVFDPDLVAAVRRYQTRHGLDPDGVVGASTLEALDVSPAERARQIELNLERRRSMPRSVGERYILVNVPAFGLEVIESGETVMAMKVIVGMVTWPTRDFTGQMTYVVLNPSWHVPTKIAAEEIVPVIRRDPGYLERNRIRVFAGGTEDGEEVDPRDVRWSRLTADHFPYLLHQDPGPTNPLGKVKLMLPNPYDVYLHDTPARGLFDRAERTFSHGCVRVERAVDLAEYALRGDRPWTREAMDKAFASGVEQTVRLLEPIPVHLVYWTAFIGRAREVEFRKDIYGWDRELERSLTAPASPVL